MATRPLPPELLGLINGTFTAVGGLFLVIGLGFAYHTYNFVARAETTTGQVVALGYRHQPVVEFTSAQGQQIRFKSPVGSSWPRFQLGEAVEVLYDPQNPQKAKINRFWELWFFPVVFGGLGAVFFLTGAGSWLMGIR